MEGLFARGMTPARRRTLGWGIVVAVWVPMAALIIWGRGGVLDLLQMRREVENLRAEIATLKIENERLREEIRRLQTDPSAYEAPAREMLMRKKRGEVVLYLPPPGLGLPAPVPAPPPPSRAQAEVESTENRPAVNAPPAPPPASGEGADEGPDGEAPGGQGEGETPGA